MKFTFFVFAALVTCAAAQPQLGALLGGAGGGLLGIVGNPAGFLHDVDDLVTGPDGLLGQLVKSGLGQAVGQIANGLGNIFGLKGLGCVLKNTLNQVSGLVRDVDKLLTGLVCTAGTVALETLRPILASVGQLLEKITGIPCISGIVASLDVFLANNVLCALKGILHPVANTVDVLGAQIGGQKCTPQATLRHP